MAKRALTVFLVPDEDGYQAIVPHYPNCTAWGATVEEALWMVKDAMEGILASEAKHDGDPFPDYARAAHVVVGEVEIEVPDRLIEKLAERRPARSP